MLFHLVRSDYKKMAAVHRDMGLIGEDVSLSEFEEALRDISEPIFGRKLEDIDIPGLLMKLIQTARRFNMTLQPNLLLLQKSMVIIEGVGRQLYPDVNMWEVAKPLIFKWMTKEKFSPKAVAAKGKEKLEELVETAFELPTNLNTLVRKTLREEIRIGFVHHRLETVTDELENAGRRIGGGIIVASLVLAASVVSVLSEGQGLAMGLPGLSWAGFIVAGVMGFALFRKRGNGK
jgi:ubiquinone biosynthesis protein